MEIFAVIADPTRRAMLDMMRDGEHAAGAFVAAFPTVSQPAISQHLKVLRDAGLVSVRADKQRRYYSLNRGGLVPILDWIAAFDPSVVQPVQTPATLPAEPAPKPAPRTKSKSAPEAELMLDLFG